MNAEPDVHPPAESAPLSELRFGIVGHGRAGGSMRTALETAGARCLAVLGRSDEPATIDPTIDLVVLGVPDRAIAEVAALVPVGPLVVHLSGVTPLSPLRAHHARCGSLHPLVSLPDPVVGAAALASGAHVAVAGADDDIVHRLTALVEAIGARPFVVADNQRALYHATASVAANHLVALSAQVERLAASAGVPMAPFLAMMRAVLDNVESVGATDALTGPVARSDWSTVRSHLAALPAEETTLYVELAQACAAVAGTAPPTDLFPSVEETP